MINGNIKEALNLCRMEIHGENSVRSGGGEHICYDLRGDRVSCLGFSVLARVAEIRDNGSYSSGGSAAERIYHNDELHEVIVYGITGGLHNEYVGTADGFLKGYAHLAVSKVSDGAFSHGETEVFGNVFRCLGVRGTGKDFDVLSVNVHFLRS